MPVMTTTFSLSIVDTITYNIFTSHRKKRGFIAASFLHFIGQQDCFSYLAHRFAVVHTGLLDFTEGFLLA